MPAIYGLIRTTPRYVVDVLIGKQTKFFKERTFDELFQLMVKDKDIAVKFNYEVLVRNMYFCHFALSVFKTFC